MAEFELDRTRANFAAARARAIARGVHIGHTTPPGYVKSSGGTLTVDPDRGPHIAELFKHRAAGATWHELAVYLHEAGLRTGRGNEYFSASALRSLVLNRVYRGEVRSGELRNHEAHEPLVDEVTWQHAQTPNPRRHPNEIEPALLAGIVRCASCRGALSPERTRNSHGTSFHMYICGKFHAGGQCPAPTSIVSHRIEPYVQILFFRALSHPPPEVDYRRQQVRRLRTKLDTAEQALTAFRDDDRIEDVLGRDQFRRLVIGRYGAMAQRTRTAARCVRPLPARVAH